ncbi:MAG TPA: polyphosphate kinase 1 [Vicinamibacteria bacterium]|nr:polyphosphate kinase 1 [Vicinamibacteria bacterium]
MKPPRAHGKPKKREPELFLNRELSWLQFNGRVLEEAVDPANPLLERLKFATIVASNLDEFFMVRVAALQHAVQEGDTSPDLAGLTPGQQLKEISLRAHEMVDQLYRALSDEILPALAERGIRLVSVGSLDPGLRPPLARHFRDEILPVLTPLAIDFSRPFPMLLSLSLNLAVLLGPAEGEDQKRLAVVQVPARLPRLVRPVGGDGTSYVLLEDLIRSELSALFPGQEVQEAAVFRVSRDAELDLDDEGGRDYLEALEEELRKRRRSQVVRLELEASASEALLALLTDRLEVTAGDVYRVRGQLDIRALHALVELPALEDLRDAPLKPLAALEAKAQEAVFEVLDERDVLFHHPYDSFDPVVSLVSRAADDPDVLAIKQTLYRTSGDSPVVQALARAAEQGKQVTVLVELLARFDEQSNLRWARSLEEAGAHVIYGIRGFKTHAKICLVVRRGRQGIRRYVHLGTGNYNDRTARAYSDFGLMTADSAIGEDASAFFNTLTGYSDAPRMKKLAMAPTGLRERFLKLIERERRRAEEGQAAEIRAKMNSLVDEDIIRALYDASRAGVRVRLNVRGICCLRPGLKGVSDSIEVVSIVDRFLEHARVFAFRNGGDEDVYLGSVDWMPRNLDRRIELLFPVEAPEPRQKVLAALEAMFADNVKARALLPDGSYRRRRPAKGDDAFRAQLHLYREAQKAVDRARAASGVLLAPLTSPEG